VVKKRKPLTAKGAKRLRKGSKEILRTYTGAERKICPVGKFSEGAGLQRWRQRTTENHRERGIQRSVRVKAPLGGLGVKGNEGEA
jgi:hypothetical protein